MKAPALLFLRVSVALLIIHWGIDKIVDPAHALAVSDRFYGGLVSLPTLIPFMGAGQIVVGVLALVGVFRRIVDPIVGLLNLGTSIGVWRSIVDPWGWYLEGTNVLFFPSLIVLAASLALIAMRTEETFVLDRRRRAGAPAGVPEPIAGRPAVGHPSS